MLFPDGRCFDAVTICQHAQQLLNHSPDIDRFIMILDENEKTQYNVTSGMDNLTVQDEKSISRYNTSDRPPSYEALFATTSTPSSFDPIATQSTAVQPSTVHFLPCVIPREFSPATLSEIKHNLTLSRNIQTLRQCLRQPFHQSIPTIPPNPQHNPIRLPRLPRRPQPSLHLPPAPPKR
jgi:hypothetical protein